MRQRLPRRRAPQGWSQQRGQAMSELAMLTPILVLLCLAIVQLIIYLQSATSAQYAAFVAARAYQVYGDRTLKEIDYPRLGHNYDVTNENQTIAEAAAEKVMFESLLWEHRNIVVNGDRLSLDRYYKDGMDVSHDGASTVDGGGAVRVNFLTQSDDYDEGGVELTYCMPIVFPGLKGIMKLSQEEWPCQTERFGNRYRGIAISKTVLLGREPLAK